MRSLTKVCIILNDGATNVTNACPTRTRHFVASRFLDKFVAAFGTRANLGIRNGLLNAESTLGGVLRFDFTAFEGNVRFVTAVSTRFEPTRGNGTPKDQFRLGELSLKATFGARAGYIVLQE